ncbi:leucine-rich repeat-containing protein [Reticulomyxa filosa]|uniref:Leucine-rich repeat-containing protein n=1 Tax=Reticulomyxa filosa TaxID=46433 RepID=X6M8L5_RETFI|nr:leucine-rich repeat-containing protein [Reticulomyxa filosa]|eukprot:ETO09812.1 leucine-rich repeat-containing protein [Reticulomyxa filosa]
MMSDGFAQVTWALPHTRVLAGLMISVAFSPLSNFICLSCFVLITIDGIEVTDIKGDKYLYDALTVLLRHNSSVRSLVLDGVVTGPEWGDLLHEGLNQNQRSALIRFGLKNAKLGEKGMTSFINGNKQLARQPECIYLTKTGASAKQMVQVIGTFIGKSEYGSGLTELDLSDNPLESRGTQALASRLATDFPDLKVLRLANCHIDVPRLLSAIEQAPKKNLSAWRSWIYPEINVLRKMDLFCLELWPSYTQFFLLYCLKEEKERERGEDIHESMDREKKGYNLMSMYITYMCVRMGLNVAASLVNDQMKYYVQLEASDNDIGPEGAIMIASILRMTDRVMTLKLNNCDMGHEGMGYVIKSLENQPYLRTLELNNNCKREQWTVGKYRVAEGLKALLEKSSVLERLSLHNDPENGYQCDLDDFLVSLRSNATLISLDISGNSLTNENLQALKDVVIKNEVLQELRWDNNSISSRHIVAMTHALKHNRVSHSKFFYYHLEHAKKKTYSLSLQLVEFPDQDFERELAQAGKDRARVMELQMVKKNFYQALFENKRLVGFEAAPLAMRRNMKKRHSLLPSEYKQREVQEKKAPPRGNQLMIPGAEEGD